MGVLRNESIGDENIVLENKKFGHTDPKYQCSYVTTDGFGNFE